MNENFINNVIHNTTDNQESETDPNIRSMPIVNYHNLLTSTELSKIVAIAHPEINDMRRNDIVVLDQIITALFTGDDRNLLLGIEYLTSTAVREFIEEALFIVNQKKQKLDNIKEIDLILSENRDSLLDTEGILYNMLRKNLDERCARLKILANDELKD